MWRMLFEVGLRMIRELVVGDVKMISVWLSWRALWMIMSMYIGDIMFVIDMVLRGDVSLYALNLILSKSYFIYELLGRVVLSI
jgi:hypothetical protein